MRGVTLHLTVCVLAGLAPLWVPADAPSSPATATAEAFPGWPTTFEGKELTRVAAQPGDARFVRDTDGRVARFAVGDGQLLVRWSASPTRHLHPSSVCFESLGFVVTPAPRVRGDGGVEWTSYTIRRDAESDAAALEVRERVVDESGRSWPDPIDWYWASLLGQTSGPTFAYTWVLPPEGATAGR